MASHQTFHHVILGDAVPSNAAACRILWRAIQQNHGEQQCTGTGRLLYSMMILKCCSHQAHLVAEKSVYNVEPRPPNRPMSRSRSSSLQHAAFTSSSSLNITTNFAWPCVTMSWKRQPAEVWKWTKRRVHTKYDRGKGPPYNGNDPRMPLVV